MLQLGLGHDLTVLVIVLNSFKFGTVNNDMTHHDILLEFMHVTTVAIDIARIFSDKLPD